MNIEDIKEGDILSSSEYKQFLKLIRAKGFYTMVQNPSKKNKGFDIGFYECDGSKQVVGSLPRKEGSPIINFKVKLKWFERMSEFY